MYEVSVDGRCVTGMKARPPLLRVKYKGVARSQLHMGLTQRPLLCSFSLEIVLLVHVNADGRAKAAFVCGRVPPVDNICPSPVQGNDIQSMLIHLGILRVSI